MKKAAIFVILSMAAVRLLAQDYLLTFAGTGASSTVDSVKVENITSCTSVTFAGTDTLHLAVVIGIGKIAPGSGEGLKIIPNPFPGSAEIEFESPIPGDATIEICDNAGKQVIRKQHELQQGRNRILVSGLRVGSYIIRVRSEAYSYSGKMISSGNGTGKPEITFISSESGTRLKSMSTIIQMQYNAGDLLKITGKSGIYKTVVMLVPVSSQAVTFNFVACTDADGNNYAVVLIGTQTWMEENLNTTKYQDSSPIPEAADSATWGSTPDGAWCNYHNDPMEGQVYGHLYNNFTIQDPRGVCPFGWRIPADSDFSVLESFLGGIIVAGQKLKENCDTRWAYWDTTWGSNTSGFTAKCANFRTGTGSWSLAPNNDHDSNFWTCTNYSPGFAWWRGLRWCYNDVFRAMAVYRSGYSIRCIK
ncbi:MAG: T9SS type A sorting domain-containing protein [Bacteroidetes bacterium]|nr:T9SS type A sorting domain-containing protein [Bacteroidota bacterium]